MTTLYAQPYDISAIGFYFDSREDYDCKAAKTTNACGTPVEEFEIQFIEGDAIDARLFSALGVHQGDVAAFLDAVDNWSGDEKLRVIIAVGEDGYRFELGRDDPSRFDMELYECDSLRDLARQFIDDGLFGDIPERIQFYLDYDAIARDLSMNYSELTIDNAHYVYRLE